MRNDEHKSVEGVEKNVWKTVEITKTSTKRRLLEIVVDIHII